jgi:dTDP-4-dehydrorhamnose 3,5-epimerase
MQQATTTPKATARRNAAQDTGALPYGVELRPLTVHRDDRGLVAEIFRDEWPTGIAPVQWTIVVSEAAVMRGVHVHLRHDDYFVLLQGAVCAGLRDLRPGSPSAGRAALLDLDGDAPAALVIPHGVAHGFYFFSPSTFLLGASHYYEPADELGCHWRDPELGLAWPVSSARLSMRDAALPGVRDVARQIPPWRGD